MTKTLMRLTTVILGGLGLTLIFFPQETLTYLGGEQTYISVMLVQLVGGAYQGFAYLCWTSKDNIIGGIYSRPLTTSLFLHFTVSAIVMVKIAMRIDPPIGMILIAGLFSFLSMIFGILMFWHPLKGE